MNAADRELIELAAKAAGIGGGWGDKLDYHNGLVDLTGYWVLDGEELYFWNPLTDDGDALRLAVALNLSLSVLPGSVEVESHEIGLHISNTGDPGDTAALLRQAIVTVASEVARAAG